MRRRLDGKIGGETTVSQTIGAKRPGNAYPAGVSDEPESLTLPLLRDMRAEIGEMRATMATKADLADVRSDLTSLRSDVSADFIDVRRKIAGVGKDLSGQIVGLRRAVVEYHTSVIGHGVIISEREARLRRVEQRLDLAAGPEAY